jgi:cell division protein FtsB
MRRVVVFVLLATLSALPMQGVFAAPQLIAQEGNANTRSGGDTDAELRAYFERETKILEGQMAAMHKEMDAMHKEMDAMKAEMAKMKKEYPPNRKP